MKAEAQPSSWPADLPEPPSIPARNERRDAAEHRRRILEVARRLFTEHGVDAVSMHQIAQATNIGQGTLYRRYAGKGELCMDLLSERHELLVQEIATLFAETAGVPVLTRLDGVLALSVTFLEEQSALLSPIVMSEVRNVFCEDAAAQPPPPFYLWLQGLFARLLTEAERSGELAPLDIPYTTSAILASLNPMLYRIQREEYGFTPERILRGLRHLYIDGLGTKGSSCGQKPPATPLDRS